MHATFPVVERSDVKLAFEVRPVGLRLYGCILAFFGVVGVGTLLGYGTELKDQKEVEGAVIATAMFFIAGFGLASYRCGVIFDKEAHTMVQWSQWFGLVRRKVHSWNEIDELKVSCADIAATEVTSGTEYPIIFRVGFRRCQLVWPWACRSRQEAFLVANEIGPFMGKPAFDSSIKAVWSTPQDGHII